MNTGGLWFPKNDEALATACINGKNNKEDYDKHKVLLPGALVDVALGVNDFNNKTYVAKIDLVKQSPYKQEEIYLWGVGDVRWIYHYKQKREVQSEHQ